jgi:hypothetical protein
MRSSSSRALIAFLPLKNRSDGAPHFEKMEISLACASSEPRRDAEKSQSNQPDAPDDGRRFYLAVRGSSSRAGYAPAQSRCISPI